MPEAFVIILETIEMEKPGDVIHKVKKYIDIANKASLLHCCGSLHESVSGYSSKTNNSEPASSAST